MGRRVVFLVPTLAVAGGSVKVASWLANRFAKEGCEVHVISCEPFDSPAFPLDSGIEFVSGNFPHVRELERARYGRTYLRDYFTRNNIDLVFGIGTFETLYAIAPCKACGVSLVFCDHGALVNQWADRKMRVIRYLDAKFSDRVVVLTEDNGEDYRRLFHIPERKIACIPNAVPSELSDCGANYDPETKRIVWAGRLSPEKGVDHLVEIAKRVMPCFPDWKMDIFGDVDPSLGYDVAQALDRAGVGEQCVLRGREGDVRKIYSGYSIGLLTSLREGFSLFLLEGKACGLPLISFDVNHGPRDIVQDGVEGFLIPCYDCDEYSRKLSLLMNDASLRRQFSDATLKTLGRFQGGAVFERWRDLTRSLA